MEKVKLTGTQAVALEAYMSTYGKGGIWEINAEDREKAVVYFFEHRQSFTSPKYRPLNDLSLDTFIGAVYGEYVVELSKEEKVRQMYNDIKMERNEVFDPQIASNLNRHMRTIQTVLDLLEVKIEGVNK